MNHPKPASSIPRSFQGLCLVLAAVLGLAPLIHACSAPEHPAKVAGASLRVENLYAFAKLYGYVRYFHPSDAAAAVDWERFAVHGARVVDEASPEELADVLAGLFGPIAPTVQVYRQGEGPPLPAVLDPADTSGLELVAWQHVGIGLGNPGPYRSARLHRAEATQQQPSFGTVTQFVEASPYRGFEVRLEVAARAEVSGAGNQAQAWLRVDRPQRQVGFFDNMQDRAVTSADWSQAEIVGTVADDAERIFLGGLLVGAGSAFFDDFRLSVRPPGDEAWQVVDLKNAGFESAQGEDVPMPPGWGGGGQGYEMNSVAGGSEGAQSLRIDWKGATESGDQPAQGGLFEARPEPGEVVEKSLGSGLMVRIPLALYSSKAGTAPGTLRPDGAASPDELSQALAALDLASLTASDPALRVADVVIAWNVLQHFYPYFDVVDVEWDAVMRESLRRAAADKTSEDFLHTLRWMVAQLGDGHGSVFHISLQQQRGLPIQLAWVEGRVVITAVDSSAADAACFQLGDVVTSVDGRPVDVLVEEHRAEASGSPQWKTVRALRSLVGGEDGSVARLVLDRGGQEVTCEVARTAQGRVAEERPEAIAVLDGGIVYVDLGRAPMAEIAARIEEIAAAPGVVFDLRGYPQGNHAVLQHLTDEPLQSAQWQVPQRIYPDQEKLVGYDTSGRWLLEPAEPRVQGEVVFLTDGRAISYAESVMGIVEHYLLGEIVGSATAGANGNVNAFGLPGGFRVAWTGMRVVKHDGSQHHLVGIQPTVPVEPTLAGVRAGRDEVLERALELIRERRKED